MMRDMEDIIIKTYYCWNKSVIDVKELILKFILTNSNDVGDRLSYSRISNTNIIINKITLNINNEEQIYNNNNLINKILIDCNLSIEQFLECANKRGFKIK